jgi:hypothetical protein
MKMSIRSMTRPPPALDAFEVPKRAGAWHNAAMAKRGAATACCFCNGTTEPLIAGRRADAPDKAVCPPCARSLRAEHAGARCDFCDHPDDEHAEASGACICAACLDLARDIVHDSEAPTAGTEAHLDPGQLWSELTPAPVPVVDEHAPATAHAELALALLHMGLHRDARAEVDKALAMDARHAIALRVRAQLDTLKQ